MKPDFPNDFEVRYRFLSADEGGRYTGTPYQGYRSDWVYADDVETNPKQAWMIWPRFLDQDGRPIPDGTRVPEQGVAQMAVVNKDFRRLHKTRIRSGVKGYLVEGSKKVAEATVIRVVELSDA